MSKEIYDLIGLDTREEKYKRDITDESFYGFPIEPILEAEERLASHNVPSVAYFSMEYGLAPSVYHLFKSHTPTSAANILSDHEVFSNMKDMDYYHYLPLKNKILDLPIYSGGLGVLAGDTLKSTADLKISLAAIGILWNKGYFRQRFWFKAGGQIPEVLSWDPTNYPGLIPLKHKVAITLSGQKLTLKLWKYYVYSYDLKNVVPLILLDANVAENPDYFRELNDQLYRSTNGWIKIAQRMILGMGGVQALKELEYSVKKYHLNEGHAAFAFVEKAKEVNPEKLKKNFIYTCHTPVEAGHDRFNLQELEAALGEEGSKIIREMGLDEKNRSVANLTQLAINASNKINGVSKKHGEVMHIQFPQYKERINSITNGVHTFTWMSAPIKELLLKYKDQIGDWEADPTLLSNVSKLREDPSFRQDLLDAHQVNKQTLSEFLKPWHFDDKTFTIAWARRIAPYKRPGLLLEDVNRLLKIAKKIGPLQIVIAGKAHPQDLPASIHMDQMLEKITMLSGEKKVLRICFLENYDTYFAKLLTSSVDVWLNNPLPPFEASGTSGMKAIINGVLQLSTLDGWVVEAAGWNIGKIFGYVPQPGELGSETDFRMGEDSAKLYEALESLIPQYYQTQNGRIPLKDSEWVDMMINCISSSSYFSTHRMVREYHDQVWKS